MKYAENINIPAHGLSDEQKRKADEELLTFRKARLSGHSDRDSLFAGLMQLRYKMEDYSSQPLEKGTPGNDLFFGSFLSQYIKVLNRTQEDFAAEIDVHPTKLSRLINNRDEPKLNLFYRLESHSGHTIPALTWWKAYIKQRKRC